MKKAVVEQEPEVLDVYDAHDKTNPQAMDLGEISAWCEELSCLLKAHKLVLTQMAASVAGVEKSLAKIAKEMREPTMLWPR